MAGAYPVRMMLKLKTASSQPDDLELAVTLNPGHRYDRFGRALRDLANRASAASSDAAHVATGANSLLAALPSPDYQRFLAASEPVTLKAGEVLHEPGVPILHVYFPIDCVVSLLATAEAQHHVAVGLAGHEGMVGISLALGIDDSSVRALVQGAGTATRMESARFRREFLQSKPLQRALFRYEHALMGRIAQSAACNRFHPVQARMACYLLASADCARSNRVHLTQEFLADMLGVRRVSVTNAAGVLRKRVLIQYIHGEITILDRQGLAAVACGCYEVMKRL